MKKVYILGTDKIGWSIDKDRMYTIKAIEMIKGYETTTSYFKADIIYVVWWNQLLSFKYILLNKIFKKKIIACITNDLTHQEDDINKLLSIVDIFVYANSKQKNKLLELGVNRNSLYFNPFYVDESVFNNLEISKEDICNKFNLNYQDIKDKKLIGSFQRDSLGTDLSQAKWQKDPDMLIDIMKKLDNRKYILLLAGPRRHYIVNKCKEFNVNYIFVGDERYINNNIDDLLINAINIEKMPYLYSLIDLYIVSSKSEGGPKAIPESILCGTPVLSTSVGFAEDLLNDANIYKNSKEAVLKIDNSSLDSKVNKYYTFSLFRDRIEKILKGLD